ncbi:MAG TPA: alpha-glucuronidase family glycosyl hydrolase, partial [Polyangiaceae bacterium]|nr:alpha-glucuronidase family glycosyl hydrolase [Polyangiaceae bacterium]
MRPPDEDGYELWLRYRPLRDTALVERYREQLRSVVALRSNPTLDAAVHELSRGLSGLLGSEVGIGRDAEAPGALVLGQRGEAALAAFEPPKHPPELGRDGFLLQAASVAGGPRIGILGSSDLGVLYGAFHLLRLLQCSKDIERLSTWSRPRTALRVLDHWDNLDRSVERGYAGFSLWNWHALPHYKDPRYVDYA